MREKRKLSPNDSTPLGIVRKMSTDVKGSPVLRMRMEMWGESLQKELQVGGTDPIAPDDANDTSLPASTGTSRAGQGGPKDLHCGGNRYGLVVPNNPLESGENHYGLVVNERNSDNLALRPVNRITKTPRRRLLSEGVFEWMMNRESPQSDPTFLKRNRSNSVRHRSKVVPNSQMLMSSFLTPKRNKGE